MLVLHGSWLPSSRNGSGAGFVLWAENSTTTAGPALRPDTQRGRQARPHPFAAPAEALRTALSELLPTAAPRLRQDTEDLTVLVWLPSAVHGPQASPGLLRPPNGHKPGRLQLALWSVPALRLWPTVVLGMLSRLPSEPDTSPGIKIGAGLRFWQGKADWFALFTSAYRHISQAALEAALGDDDSNGW